MNTAATPTCFPACSIRSTIRTGSRSKCSMARASAMATWSPTPARMANVLVSRGVKPGDRVAARPKNRCRRWCCISPRFRAGAVYLPLNTAYTLKRARLLHLRRRAVRWSSCDPSKAKASARIAAKVKAKVETLGPDGKGSLTDAVAEADAAFATVARATTTSPPSSTPRAPRPFQGAMLTHDNLASNSLSLVDYWRFTDRDVLIHALPIYHTHGLFVASNVTLFARASMIFLPKLDPEMIIKLMARATVLMACRRFIPGCCRARRYQRNRPGICGLFHFGLRALPRPIPIANGPRAPPRRLERYGMTETNMNTSNPYDASACPAAVGHPLPAFPSTFRDRKPQANFAAPRHVHDPASILRVSKPDEETVVAIRLISASP